MRDFASKPRQEAAFARAETELWILVDLWVLALGSFPSGPSEEERSACALWVFFVVWWFFVSWLRHNNV